MSMIGYSETGYRELMPEISRRKQNLLNILDSFSEVQTSIANCWKGEDATAYSEELEKVLNATKESVTETYDTMRNQFDKTYQDWIDKQRRQN